MHGDGGGQLWEVSLLPQLTRLLICRDPAPVVLGQVLVLRQQMLVGEGLERLLLSAGSKGVQVVNWPARARRQLRVARQWQRGSAAKSG